MKIYILLLPAIILVNSCNTFPNQQAENPATVQQDQDIFVGAWRFHSAKFNGKSKNDGSMRGIVAKLNLVENTKESYILTFLESDLLFTKENDSTLEGVDNNLVIEYRRADQRLRLKFVDGFDDFYKLK